MQLLTAPPRTGFTAAQVKTVLQNSASVSIDYGLELLYANGGAQQNATLQPLVQASLSGNVLAAEQNVITRDNYATVHGTCALTLDTELQWGYDMVRPYMVFSSPAEATAAAVTGVRFNLGCYVVTSPQYALTVAAKRPVIGYDPLYLLNNPIGDSYHVRAGANILATVSTILDAQTTLWGGVFIADPARADGTTATLMSWPLDTTHTGTTWLNVINDLLAAIGYRGLWCDENGNYRADPYVAPAQRALEYMLDAGFTDQAAYNDAYFEQHQIVSPAQRTYTYDTWNTPNWWRFVQNNPTTAPVEGNGQYTVQDIDGGPTSQLIVGRVIKAPVQYLDAATQADLVTQGNAVVVADRNVAETVQMNTAPLPIAGHFDVVGYSDEFMPDTPERKLMAQSWSLPLTGGDMTWMFRSIRA
jgi:hypothetical protein